jgi:hypothetical protein
VDAQGYGDFSNLWSLQGVPTDYCTAEDYPLADILASDVVRMQDLVRMHTGLNDRSHYSLQESNPHPDLCQGSSQPTGRPKPPQVVRSWLLDHASCPYPTRAEKLGLIEATGCTERQLDACLSNFRARNKKCKSPTLHEIAAFIDVMSSAA